MVLHVLTEADCAKVVVKRYWDAPLSDFEQPIGLPEIELSVKVNYEKISTDPLRVLFLICEVADSSLVHEMAAFSVNVDDSKQVCWSLFGVKLASRQEHGVKLITRK